MFWGLPLFGACPTISFLRQSLDSTWSPFLFGEEVSEQNGISLHNAILVVIQLERRQKGHTYSECNLMSQRGGLQLYLEALCALYDVASHLDVITTWHFLQDDKLWKPGLSHTNGSSASAHQSCISLEALVAGIPHVLAGVQLRMLYTLFTTLAIGISNQIRVVLQHS